MMDRWQSPTSLSRLCKLTGLVLLCLTTPDLASAQDVSSSPAASSDSIEENPIDVPGLTRSRVRALVARIGGLEADGTIARYRERLCLRVEGLRPPYAEAITRQVDEIARAANVRFKGDGCNPNLIVLAPRDPDGYVAKLIKWRPMLGGDPGRGLRPRALLRQLRQGRAVRWFATSQSLALRSGMWRLAAPARTGKLATYIILDVTRLAGVTWRQLGDYIAMVALTNPALDESYSTDLTILSLFDQQGRNEKAPRGATQFDRDLAWSIYHVDENLSAPLQLTKVVDDLASGEASRSRAVGETLPSVR